MVCEHHWPWPVGMSNSYDVYLIRDDKSSIYINLRPVHDIVNAVGCPRDILLRWGYRLLQSCGYIPTIRRSSAYLSTCILNTRDHQWKSPPWQMTRSKIATCTYPSYSLTQIYTYSMCSQQVPFCPLRYIHNRRIRRGNSEMRRSQVHTQQVETQTPSWELGRIHGKRSGARRDGNQFKQQHAWYSS